MSWTRSNKIRVKLQVEVAAKFGFNNKSSSFNLLLHLTGSLSMDCVIKGGATTGYVGCLTFCD